MKELILVSGVVIIIIVAVGIISAYYLRKTLNSIAEGYGKEKGNIDFCDVRR